MIAHVLLNLLNELRKSDKMRGMPSGILSNVVGALIVVSPCGLGFSHSI